MKSIFGIPFERPRVRNGMLAGLRSTANRSRSKSNISYSCSSPGGGGGRGGLAFPVLLLADKGLGRVPYASATSIFCLV